MAAYFSNQELSLEKVLKYQKNVWQFSLILIAKKTLFYDLWNSVHLKASTVLIGGLGQKVSNIKRNTCFGQNLHLNKHEYLEYL